MLFVEGSHADGTVYLTKKTFKLIEYSLTYSRLEYGCQKLNYWGRHIACPVFL